MEIGTGEDAEIQEIHRKSRGCFYMIPKNILQIVAVLIVCYIIVCYNYIYFISSKSND